MKDGLPETVPELCDYIERYAGSIFVLENIDGEWNHALSELPGKSALKHAFRWIKEGIIPVRVLSDEEVAERKRQSAGGHQ